MSAGEPSLTIKRSSFNVIVVVAVAALMISSFFGGYILNAKTGGIGGTNTIIQQGGGGQQQQQQPPTTAPAGQPSQQPPTIQPAAATNVSSIPLDDGDPVVGKPNAPLTMVEYLDFQCPFCESFFNQTLPQIQKEYIDTGKVKFVAKDFPLDNLHPNARSASIAAQCANEQGKFWPYHDIIFKNQKQWENLDTNSAANTFKQYASTLKLNTANFNSCFDSKKYADEVNKDNQEGTSFGASGTPTFYIGNEKEGYTQLVGAQPFATFKTTIDQALS